MKKYLMITYFQEHWRDGLITGYPNHFIHDEVMANLREVERNDTIFVQLSSDKKVILNVKKGFVSDLEFKNNNKVGFKINITGAIENFQSMNLSVNTPYWKFFNEDTINDSTINDYIPNFFNNLKNTKNWQYFENETFKLLKLLGINNSFKFSNQRGEADGFFRFENLAVIYDTTLEDDFVEKKKTQIDNFCSQLEKGSIFIHEKNTKLTFHEAQKQVWIVTRGLSRILQKYNNIIVKEISINDLIDLYLERLESQYTTDVLENKLRMLGSD